MPSFHARALASLLFVLSSAYSVRSQDLPPAKPSDNTVTLSKNLALECPESLPLGIAIQFQGTFSNEGEVPIDNVTFTVDVSAELALSDFQTSQGTWTPGIQHAVLNMGTVSAGVTVGFSFLISTVALGTSNLMTQFSGESSDACDIEIVPPSGTVLAEKYIDLNSNSQLDVNEPFAEGWEFFLDENQNQQFDEGERTAVTDTNGVAIFANVPLGAYGLFEVARDGWIITEPAGFAGYSVEITQSGQILVGRFGNFRVPVHPPVAHIMDPGLFWAIDRFGDPMPDGTFDFNATDVKGTYDHTYLNVFFDFNGDGRIADYPVNKDSDQQEWVIRNIPLPGTSGLETNPSMSAWFGLPDLSLDLEADYRYVAGITSYPVDVQDGTPIDHLSIDLGGQLKFGSFQWGGNDPEGQAVEDEPEPSPESVEFPAITLVDDIPGPLDENGMPDITQQTNECGPTSAANSLIWLARKHDFEDRLPQKDGSIDQEQLILDLMQAMAGNQTRPFGGLHGNELHDGKKQYIMEKNLPLVVEGGNTDANARGAKAFDFIRNEVAKGQDVELLVKWPGPGSHWVTISGYATSSDKKAVLFVHDPDDGKTAEVVWELEVNESNQITGRIKSPSQSRMLWAVAESPVANIGTETDEPVPQSFRLFENYPNPFDRVTTIGFALPEPSHVEMALFDVRGRRLRTIAEGAFTAGVHEVEFDAGSLVSGTYVCRLEAGGMSDSRLLIVAR